MNDTITAGLKRIIFEAVRDALQDQPASKSVRSSGRLTLLNEMEVSEWISVPVNTLRDWRRRQVNIPFIPLSDRKVRYDQDAVTSYLKSLEVQVREP